MSASGALAVEPLAEADLPWAAALLTERWGGPVMVSRGRRHRLEELAGCVAWRGGVRVGLALWRRQGRAGELVSLDAVESGRGVGSALLATVEAAARQAGCRRVWLITTNDNLEALRFYQRRGYALVRVHRGAVERSRRLKPSIPQIGEHGIPLRDELELSRRLV